MKNRIIILGKRILLLFTITMFVSCNSASAAKQDMDVSEYTSPLQEPLRKTVSIATSTTEPCQELRLAGKAIEDKTVSQTTETTVPIPTQKSTQTPTPTPDLPGYAIRLTNSSSLLDAEKLPWVKELSFNIVQVEGLEDDALQDKINKTILEAMTHWVEYADPIIEEEGIVLLIPREDATPTIHLQTNAYLSMSNHFDLYNPNRGDAIIDVITIDMKTGERVKLNDLFNVDIAFAERIISLTEGMSIIWPATTKPTDLLEEIQNASLNNLEIRVGYPHRIGAMMHRTSFHLKENELIITYHREGALLLEELRSITIDIDDYEDFLLVEKW